MRRTKLFVNKATQKICSRCDGTYICPKCDGYNESSRASKPSIFFKNGFMDISKCGYCDYGACPECESLNHQGMLEAVPIFSIYGHDRERWPQKIQDFADGEYTREH